MNGLSTFRRGQRRIVLSAAGVSRIVALGTLVTVAILGFASVAQAAPKTSSAVAYVTDFGSGSDDECGPSCGSSIFVDALTGTAPKGTYSTGDESKTVSVKDVSVSTIDTEGAAALAPYDTVIVYQVCDIGSHAATVSALNTFLTNGGKVMLFDADRCAAGGAGVADYSAFLFPFATSSPGPQGASGSYTTVVPSTLTAGLAVGEQEGDAVGDANIFTSFSGKWCASITATNTLGDKGFVESTARTSSGGLVIYEGEDFWFTFGPTPHLRLVFDNMLKQNWAPDVLPCTIPASGISLSPPSQTQEVGATATVTAEVVDTEGNPVSGVTVSFSVDGGPNAGKTETGTTNASGQTKFTYTDTGGAGTDVLTASFSDSGEKEHTSNEATVVWGAAPPPETITTSTLSGGGKTGPKITVKEGAAASDTATISGANTATATGTVTYTVYSDSKCQTEVANAGTVSVSGGSVPASEPKILPPGIYFWQASYSGDANNKASKSKCRTEVETVLATCSKAVGEGTFGEGPEFQRVKNSLSTNLLAKGQKFNFSWEHGRKRFVMQELEGASCAVNRLGLKTFRGHGEGTLNGVPEYLVTFAFKITAEAEVTLIATIRSETTREVIESFTDEGLEESTEVIS